MSKAGRPDGKGLGCFDALQFLLPDFCAEKFLEKHYFHIRITTGFCFGETFPVFF